MKVLRIKRPGEVELYDEPLPEVGPGESLVRVGAVGLCGSDLHWFAQGGIGDAHLNRPLVLGHEFGGTVEGGPLDGRRVAVDPAIPCGACPRCKEGNINLCPTVRFAGHGATDGGLREYVAWRTELLNPVPDGFTDTTVALLEPLGVALHAFDLGHVRFAGTVAIVGCGPIGLMTIMVARAAGVSHITAVEPLAHRREAAARCGADEVLSPEQLGGASGNDDVVFEVAGTDEAVAESMALVRPGGRVVLVGIPDQDATSFPASVARRKGLTILMSRRMKAAYPRAITLVARNAIELGPLATHFFTLSDGPKIFAVAAQREGLKTVVFPSANSLAGPP
ncbi:MAG TPA: alcohol dehydrogenase catalytic domain-containing protein [Acidimicrobiales bacterium]|nr:alcohol dehydrogenase catalytic domain-containing protein [Acidimicrobiales bacterium]